MTARLLLYIDLLGFSEIVRSKPNLLPDLFRVMDKSPAHEHGTFRVIQFSDTLLVYNGPEVTEPRWKSYCAMYLCEFVQVAQNMLLTHDGFLRGLITYGQFEDTGTTPNAEYSHIRAFWGPALIKAYQTEKDIQAIGLFVDETANPFMDIFETHVYDEQKGLWFVETATALMDKFFNGTDFSYATEDIILTANESLLAYDLVYLRQLFLHAHDYSLPPRARVKYQTTWEIYRMKYNGLCAALENANFDFKKVIPINWKPFLEQIGCS
jgi:hypothetical protein